MTAWFIIVNAERVGSNMLAFMLRSHPDVGAADEIFNRQHIAEGYIGWPPVDGDAELVALREKRPVEFLHRVAGVASARGLSAFGFECLYRQVIDNTAVTEALADIADLKVIHMKRRNRLRRLVSMRRAQQTDVWWALEDRPMPQGRRPLAPIELDLETCTSDFLRVMAQERDIARAFASQDTLSIDYEDFAARPDETLGIALDFLGVERRPIDVATRKLTTVPLRKSIANYDEVRDTLREWAGYCDE